MCEVDAIRLAGLPLKGQRECSTHLINLFTVSLKAKRYFISSQKMSTGEGEIATSSSDTLLSRLTIQPMMHLNWQKTLQTVEMELAAISFN